jgi:hypothetical protein
MEWHIEKRRASDLIPLDNNPRQITELALDDLRKSFDQIGYATPISIDTDNTILSGNQRLKILHERFGENEFDVYVPNKKLNEKERELVILRLNRSAGTWDFDILGNNFEISTLQLAGFTDRELDLLEMPEMDPIPQEEGKKLTKACPRCGEVIG